MPSLALTPRGHLLFTVADTPDTRLHPAGRVLAQARGRLRSWLGSRIARARRRRGRDWPFHQTSATGATSPRGWSRPICTHPDLDTHQAPIPAPAPTDLDALAAAAPPMTGTEYVTASVLDARLDCDCGGVSIRARRIEGVGPDVSSAESPAWHPGRPRPLQPRREPSR